MSNLNPLLDLLESQTNGGANKLSTSAFRNLLDGILSDAKSFRDNVISADTSI